jgi:hypothetical protein
MGMGGQHRAPAALPPGKTRYPLYRRLGGPQGRSGRVRKISPPPGFDPRAVHPLTKWTVHIENEFRCLWRFYRLIANIEVVQPLLSMATLHGRCMCTYIHGAVAGGCKTWHVQGVYRGKVGEPDEKRLMGRHRRRWENNIRMGLQGLDVGVWTGLNWLRIETGGRHLWMR